MIAESSVFSMLQISDLHFGPPYVERVGEALLRIAPTLECDVIVASGDFTQRAKREQFEQARDYLRRLPDLPQIVIPGNHDVALYRVFERLFRPYDLYKEYISPELDSIHRFEKAFVVALNSTAPRTAISNGWISLEQLEYCQRAFAEATPGQARIVIAHHHFAPAPDYERTEVMPRAKRALDCFARLKVDVIMGGHLHRAYIGNSLDVYAGADREHGITIVQCGTTTSRRGRGREREKNSFNYIRVDEEVLRITHYMYFSEDDAFSPVSRHVFPRAPKRFFNASLP